MKRRSINFKEILEPVGVSLFFWFVIILLLVPIFFILVLCSSVCIWVAFQPNNWLVITAMPATLTLTMISVLKALSFWAEIVDKIEEKMEKKINQ